MRRMPGGLLSEEVSSMFIAISSSLPYLSTLLVPHPSLCILRGTHGSPRARTITHAQRPQRRGGGRRGNGDDGCPWAQARSSLGYSPCTHDSTARDNIETDAGITDHHHWISSDARAASSSRVRCTRTPRDRLRPEPPQVHISPGLALQTRHGIICGPMWMLIRRSPLVPVRCDHSSEIPREIPR